MIQNKQQLVIHFIKRILPQDFFPGDCIGIHQRRQGSSVMSTQLFQLELDTYYDEDVAPRYLVSEQVLTLESSNCWSILSFGIPSYQVFSLGKSLQSKVINIVKKNKIMSLIMISLSGAENFIMTTVYGYPESKTTCLVDDVYDLSQVKHHLQHLVCRHWITSLFTQDNH